MFDLRVALRDSLKFHVRIQECKGGFGWGEHVEQVSAMKTCGVKWDVKLWLVPLQCKALVSTWPHWGLFALIHHEPRNAGNAGWTLIGLIMRRLIAMACDGFHDDGLVIAAGDCDAIFLDLWFLGVRILTAYHYRWILRQLWNNESPICGTNWKKGGYPTHLVRGGYSCNILQLQPTGRFTNQLRDGLGSLNLGLFLRVWTWQAGTWQEIPLHPMVYGIFLNICHLMGIITMEIHNF